MNIILIRNICTQNAPIVIRTIKGLGTKERITPHQLGHLPAKK